MTRERKPDDVEVPDDLVSVAKQIGDTAQKFFVRGELPAFDEYMGHVFRHLKQNGWQIEGPGTYPLRSMIDNLKHERGTESRIRGSLDLWLNELEDNKSIRGFLVDPKNIATLQAAADAALPETAKVWGDPSVVKEGQRSLPKAVFNAVAERLVNRDSPERRLKKVLKDLFTTMKAYSAQDVPFIEFQGRVTEYLDKKGWLIAEPDDIHRPLASRLWTLVQEAHFKTTIPLRWELQYDTFPPRDHFRFPQEFILQHISDIGEATKAVAAELDTELKTDKGLITRHCSICGREEFTDFSWGEARRKKAPQTPVDIQKDITVKGPLKLKP